MNVTQANHNYIYNRYQFENDVKMYGTQAVSGTEMDYTVFENDVKMYGTQAVSGTEMDYTVFENDVKMYGTQAQKTKVSCIW